MWCIEVCEERSGDRFWVESSDDHYPLADCLSAKGER